MVSVRVRDKVRDILRGKVRASVGGRGVLGVNIYLPIENLL